MQDFTRAEGRLRKFPRGARVVYSTFLVFTLAAVAVSGWLGGEMLGADLARMTTYYAGGSERASAPSRAVVDGPALDLPDDVDRVTAEAMPLRKLLEVTHFHLFSMPVYLMVLSHLFMLVSWRDRTKWAWVVLATVAVAAHLVAPWLVRARLPWSSALYALSGAGLGLSFTVMSIAPLWQMWTTRSSD